MSDLRDLQRADWTNAHNGPDIGNMERALEQLTSTGEAIRLGVQYFADETFIKMARATYTAGLALVSKLGQQENYTAMNQITQKLQLVREACEAALGFLVYDGYVKGYKGWSSAA